MNYKSLLLLFSSAIAAACSTALFRFALKDRFAWKGSVGELISDLIGLLGNPSFLIALSVFVMANVLWLLVLGSQKLSLAYPVQLGLVLAINSILSVKVFREEITPTAWLGIALVAIGVVLITR